MSAPNQENKKSAEGHGDAPTDREQVAHLVPFVLRAWWLRNYKEYEGIEWHTDIPITGPFWSMYSDPFCDQGNSDYADELL
jgi:hypothetical protein